MWNLIFKNDELIYKFITQLQMNLFTKQMPKKKLMVTNRESQWRGIIQELG